MLTTTGIIIGVSAVIVLVALGNGIQAGFTEQFSALTTQITVTPSEGDRSAQPLTDADVEALADRAVAPDVTSVTPLITGSALLQQQGQVGYRTGITGTTANYADVTDLDLVVGSFFDEQQERSKAKVVVLGPRPVTELFAGNAGEAIGQRIRIGRTTFRVIGVAAPAQNDDVAYLPFDAARSYVLGGTDEVNSVRKVRNWDAWSMKSCWARTSKSRSVESVIRWRSSRTAVTCCWAAGTAWADPAETMTLSTSSVPPST